jgi:antibiotic biosynthesis monooxygenase (ABM) superfamily enzyme
MKQPNKYKLTFLVWCAIYPTVTFIFFILNDFLINLHPFLKTFVVTIILVPLMVFVFLPFIMKRFNNWLSK